MNNPEVIAYPAGKRIVAKRDMYVIERPDKDALGSTIWLKDAVIHPSDEPTYELCCMIKRMRERDLRVSESLKAWIDVHNPTSPELERLSSGLRDLI